MQSKKNLPLIAGIAIPVIMVIAVALSVYIPSLAAHPSVDFLYSETDYSSSGYYPYGPGEYAVSGGKLAVRTYPVPSGQPAPANIEPDVKLYVHDTVDNTNREVTLAEAQKLALDDSSMSPDGYDIVNGNGGGGFFPFFFSDSDYDSQYLEGHNARKKLNIAGGGNSRSFRFIGWINQ